MIDKHKQPYFACKVHGELADPEHLLNESHESTVDEIKRYRSEYADQGNEEATK